MTKENDKAISESRVFIEALEAESKNFNTDYEDLFSNEGSVSSGEGEAQENTFGQSIGGHLSFHKNLINDFELDGDYYNESKQNHEEAPVEIDDGRGFIENQNGSLRKNSIGSSSAEYKTPASHDKGSPVITSNKIEAKLTKYYNVSGELDTHSQADEPELFKYALKAITGMDQFSDRLPPEERKAWCSENVSLIALVASLEDLFYNEASTNSNYHSCLGGENGLFLLREKNANNDVGMITGMVVGMDEDLYALSNKEGKLGLYRYDEENCQMTEITDAEFLELIGEISSLFADKLGVLEIFNNNIKLDSESSQVSVGGLVNNITPNSQSPHSSSSSVASIEPGADRAESNFSPSSLGENINYNRGGNFSSENSIGSTWSYREDENNNDDCELDLNDEKYSILGNLEVSEISTTEFTSSFHSSSSSKEVVNFNYEQSPHILNSSIASTGSGGHDDHPKKSNASSPINDPRGTGDESSLASGASVFGPSASEFSSLKNMQLIKSEGRGIWENTDFFFLKSVNERDDLKEEAIKLISLILREVLCVINEIRGRSNKVLIEESGIKDLIEYAAEKGGVANEFDGKKWVDAKETIKDQFGDGKSKWAIAFSKKFQEECEKCGIYSSIKKVGDEDHPGLSLGRIPPEAGFDRIQKITEQEARELLQERAAEVDEISKRQSADKNSSYK